MLIYCIPSIFLDFFSYQCCIKNSYLTLLIFFNILFNSHNHHKSTYISSVKINDDHLQRNDFITFASLKKLSRHIRDRKLKNTQATCRQNIDTPNISCHEINQKVNLSNCFPFHFYERPAHASYFLCSGQYTLFLFTSVF